MAYFLFIIGWILIWQHYGVLGVICLAIFALLQWRKYLSQPSNTNLSSLTKTAWDSSLAEMTHAADIDRQIGSVGEVGMGGPAFWTLLLRDGAIVNNVTDAGLDLNEGKLRLFTTRSYAGEGLTLYDTTHKIMYVLPPLSFAERNALDAGSASVLTKLLAACNDENATQLHNVHGLWVPESFAAPPARLDKVFANGNKLSALLQLPADLRYADNPDELLLTPPYSLLLNDVPTDLYVCDLDQVTQSPSGNAISLRGAQFTRGRLSEGLYHLYFSGVWFNVISYSHLPTGNNLFFIEQIIPQDNGVFLLHLESSDPDDEKLPAMLPITVSWQDPPLLLPVVDNSLLLPLPNHDTQGAT